MGRISIKVFCLRQLGQYHLHLSKGMQLKEIARKWFRLPARVTVNNNPDKQSPWKEPKTLSNSDEDFPLILTFSLVFEKNTY